MRGYYVIPSDERGDPIEITGRNARQRAIQQARELKSAGDVLVFVMSFDDNAEGGFLADSEIIHHNEL